MPFAKFVKFMHPATSCKNKIHDNKSQHLPTIFVPFHPRMKTKGYVLWTCDGILGGVMERRTQASVTATPTQTVRRLTLETKIEIPKLLLLENEHEKELPPEVAEQLFHLYCKHDGVDTSVVQPFCPATLMHLAVAGAIFVANVPRECKMDMLYDHLFGSVNQALQTPVYDSYYLAFVVRMATVFKKIIDECGGQITITHGGFHLATIEKGWKNPQEIRVNLNSCLDVMKMKTVIQPRDWMFILDSSHCRDNFLPCLEKTLEKWTKFPRDEPAGLPALLKLVAEKCIGVYSDNF
jgi:hypothetical protein